MSSDKIRIDTDKLDDISRQLDRLSGSLASIGTGITGISLTARYVVPEQPDIIRNINSLKNRVSASSMYAKRLSGAVQHASAQWAAAESGVIGDLGEGEDPFSEAGGEAKEKGPLDYIFSLLKKMIGGTGILGKVISTIWSGVIDGSEKDILKGIIDIIGSAVKEGQKGTDANWVKAIFGIGEFGKTAGEVFKGALGPISWITNGLKAIIDNFDYAKEGNVPRFITESATETGVNVLLGAGGVALAALILGPTAPAIAVGAAGAAIVWGTNELFKWISGSDQGIAETIGEIVGEGTDYVVEKAGEIIDWVGEKANDAVDWATDKGKQLLDTGAQVILDAGNAVCNWFGGIFA